ncbi:MAG TPA: conjugative transposon protein TraN, partial [Puia sp.]|nr:conjugative transposon protein TraN [Puia sp.]
MKRPCALLIILLSVSGFSQTTIPGFPISISVSATSNLIFHYPIVSVDRGSPDILVQKARGVDTILQVKARRHDFPLSNLTVITADGKLNSFIVQYKEDPDSLNLYFNKPAGVFGESRPAAPALLDKSALLIQRQPEFLHHHIRASEIDLSLKGIYIDRGYLWFRLVVQNHSSIDYRPEYVRFFLRSKRQAKRTALQEYELRPFFKSIAPIPGNGGKTLLLAFGQFTVPKHQQLVCEMSEEDGGRVLELPISYRTVLKAR